MTARTVGALAAVAAVALGAPAAAAAEAPNQAGGLSAIDKNITYIRTVSKNVRERIHETGCMIIAHAEAYGDCSRAKLLVEAMGKGARRSDMVKWFGHFSPIAVNIVDKDPKTSSVRLRKSDAKAYNRFNVAGARAVPYWELNKEQMPDVADDLETVNGKIKPRRPASEPLGQGHGCP
jgi:hypothetical protein